MFLSSVATIVFNINPLLRYDGYYMLSDYLEIPNLSQKSNLALIDRLRVWCLGMEPVSANRLPQQQQTAFSIYAISSFVYRWFVMGMIFWFITRVFEPYGLQVIGYLAVAIALTGSVLVPCYKAIQFFLYPGRLREVKKERMYVTTAVLAVFVAGFFLVPFPHHVRAPFVVQPADADSIFVNWPGTLGEVSVGHGESVKAGQVIARLRDPDLEIEHEKLRSELSRSVALLNAYRLQDDSPLEMARLAGETRAKIVRIKKQLAEREQQLAQLELTADRAGTVIPPPNIPPQNPHASGDKFTLTSWHGAPLEPRNLSAKLERETLLCYVGNPNRMRAILCVPQSDIKLLATDQSAEVTFNSFRGETCTGSVANVANRPVQMLPRELSATNGGLVAAKPSSNVSGETPMLTHFEVTVEFENDDLRLVPGMTGQASVKVGSASFATRTYRALSNVFKFN
jgi:putative peptide zinc metalloprotease protein